MHCRLQTGNQNKGQGRGLVVDIGIIRRGRQGVTGENRLLVVAVAWHFPLCIYSVNCDGPQYEGLSQNPNDWG